MHKKGRCMPGAQSVVAPSPASVSSITKITMSSSYLSKSLLYFAYSVANPYVFCHISSFHLVFKIQVQNLICMSFEWFSLLPWPVTAVWDPDSISQYSWKWWGRSSTLKGGHSGASPGREGVNIRKTRRRRTTIQSWGLKGWRSQRKEWGWYGVKL